MTAKGASMGALIAVDGIDAAKMRAAAKRAVAIVPRATRAGVSLWDASGIFGELVVADDEAGRASARTLVILYAADLAFRLRWEIRPAIAEGRTVAAAPYVATAVAFGRAAGLPGGWLKDLFAFAPQPDERRIVDAVPRRVQPASFVHFGCAQLASGAYRFGRREFTARVRAYLARVRT